MNEAELAQLLRDYPWLAEGAGGIERPLSDEEERLEMRAVKTPSEEIYNVGSAALLGGSGLTSLLAEGLRAVGYYDEPSVIEGVPDYRPELEDIPWTWESNMRAVGADPEAGESLLGSFADPFSMADLAVLGPVLSQRLFKGDLTLPKELEWMRDWPGHEFDIPTERMVHKIVTPRRTAMQRQPNGRYQEVVLNEDEWGLESVGLPENEPWYFPTKPTEQNYYSNFTVRDIDPPAPPTLAGELRQYHGTKKANDWTQNELSTERARDEMVMMDRMAGSHSAADPAIANIFAGALSSQSSDDIARALQRGGAVLPLSTPGRESFFPVRQPSRAPEGGVGLGAIHNYIGTDQRHVQNELLKRALRQDDYLLGRVLEQERVPDPYETAAAINLDPNGVAFNKYGETQNIRVLADEPEGYIPDGSDDYYTLDSFIDSFSPMPRDKELAHMATDMAINSLRNEGWKGIQYYNTAGIETGNSFDKRSFITFEPGDIGYVHSGMRPKNRVISRPNKEADIRGSNPGGEWLEHKKARTEEAGRRYDDWPASGYFTAIDGTEFYSSPPPRRFGTETASVRKEGGGDGTVLIPTSKLKTVPGANAEQNNVRQDTLEWMRGNVRFVDGMPMVKFPKKKAGGGWEHGVVGKEEAYPPFIQVDQDGRPYVNEGNHRIMEAIRRNEPYVRVHVKWYNGGESADTDWSKSAILDEALEDLR